MAEESDMSREVGLIAGALTHFARSKSWKDSDYWIYYWTNPDWEKVHFVLVAEAFNDQDPYESTRDVWSFLEKDLAQHPDVLKSLGLVTRSRKKIDEGGLYAIGPSYKEFWTVYPVPQH
jgi:hypothetical protein